MKPAHLEEMRMLGLLRELIDQRGTTLEDLRRRLGWEPARVAGLLEGRQGLVLGDLLALLAALETPPADFFGRLYTLRIEPADPTADDRADRLFDRSRRVVEEALARRAAWKKERGGL